MNSALRSASYRRLQFINVSADNQSIATVAADKARELVRNKGVKAMVTDTSLSDVAVNALNYAENTAERLNVPVCVSSAPRRPSTIPTFRPAPIRWQTRASATRPGGTGARPC